MSASSSPSSLTPEVALELLHADEKNIAEKLAAGQTLTSRERKHLEEIARTRTATAAVAPTPSPVPAAPAFDLDPEAGPRLIGSRVKYPEKLAHYATLFDTAERTIKRWIVTGLYEDSAATRRRQPTDLPPLHRPAEMPAWWERRMRIRCPAGVLSAAQRSGAPSAPRTAVSTPAPTVPVFPSADAPQSDSLRISPDYSDAVPLEFPAQVAAMRREQAIIKQRLETTRRGQLVNGQLHIDEGAVESLQRQSLAIGESLRKAENDLLAYQREREILVHREDVRAENNRIASTIFQNTRALVRKVRPQLAGKPPAEQDRIWDLALLHAFDALKDAKFTTPLVADSESPNL